MNKLTERRHFEKGWIWQVICTAWILFIWSNSLTPADQSSHLSGGVLTFLRIMLLNLHLPGAWLTEFVVRKCAHFTEYTVMGVLLTQGVRHTAVENSARKLIYCIFFFGIPFLDETLQLFVPGRSGEIRDVWIDMAGVLTGSLICTVILYLKNDG